MRSLSASSSCLSYMSLTIFEILSDVAATSFFFATIAFKSGLTLPDNGIEAVVVSDGVISDFSLRLIRKSQGWLEGILRGKNLSAKDVFLMTANTAGQFYIVKKEGRNRE